MLVNEHLPEMFHALFDQLINVRHKSAVAVHTFLQLPQNLSLPGCGGTTDRGN